MTKRLITWDWREYVDFDQVKNIITEVSNGQVHMYEVDTGSDQFAWVISSDPLTEEEIAEVYRNRWYGPE